MVSEIAKSGEYERPPTEYKPGDIIRQTLPEGSLQPEKIFLVVSMRKDIGGQSVADGLGVTAVNEDGTYTFAIFPGTEHSEPDDIRLRTLTEEEFRAQVEVWLHALLAHTNEDIPRHIEEHMAWYRDAHNLPNH
jgi:hypothetical protein